MTEEPRTEAQMRSSAELVVDTCFEVKDGDVVTIITDDRRKPEAEMVATVVGPKQSLHWTSVFPRKLVLGVRESFEAPRVGPGVKTPESTTVLPDIPVNSNGTESLRGPASLVSRAVPVTAKNV